MFRKHLGGKHERGTHKNILLRFAHSICLKVSGSQSAHLGAVVY